MKYIFISSSSKFRLGGHHYSIRDLANTCPDYIYNEVCQIGFAPNADLAKSVKKFVYYKTSFFNLFSIIKLLRYLRHSHNAETAIISFDFMSLGFSRLALVGRQNRVVFCKPGGKNFLIKNKQVFPIIFFSEENYNFTKQNQPKFLNCAYLIKGRVATIPIASYDKQLKISEISNKKKVFCVSRIDEEKRELFTIGLHFYHKFFDKDIYDLFIIGQPRSSLLVSDLVNLVENLNLSYNVHLLTTPDYYQNVSSFFSECDFMISNGRTVIEAISLGKPTFIPSIHTEYPILLTSDSVTELSFYNLSLRCHPQANHIQSTINFITTLTNESYESVRADTFQIFKNYYSTENSHKILLSCAEKVLSDKGKIRFEIADLRMILVGLTTITFPWLFKSLR